jgi:hypothetical protein
MKTLRWALIVIVVLTGLSFSCAQQNSMSLEEKTVRTAYAKLAYAAQVREIVRMLHDYSEPEKIDRAEFNKRLHDAEITFQLNNMKVGDISEILSKKTSDLTTQPSGDVLGTVAGDANYSFEGKEVRSGIVDLSWIKGQELYIEDWDTPFGEGLRLNREAGTNLSTYARYASYTATVTFQGKSRTYKAMFLFGTKPNGTEEILPLDLIVNVNGGGLSYFLKEPAYPGGLLHPHRNRGVIAEWLQSNQITAPGGKHEVECDLVKLKCGVASGDLLRLKPISVRQKSRPTISHNPTPGPPRVDTVFRPPLLPFVPFLQNDGTGGDACSGFNLHSGPTPYATPTDQTFHITGGHWLSGVTEDICTYTGSVGSCSSTCNVIVGALPWNETGFVSSSCHTGTVTQKLGDGNSNGDSVSCTGAAGGAVAACLFCGCNAEISLTIGGTASLSRAPMVSIPLKKIPHRSVAPGKCRTLGAAGLFHLQRTPALTARTRPWLAQRMVWASHQSAALRARLSLTRKGKASI